MGQKKAVSAAATLLSQAVEKLEQKAARDDRAGTLTYLEYEEVLRAALEVEGSLLAATEVDTALRGRLAAVRESIEAAPSLGTGDAHRGEPEAVEKLDEKSIQLEVLRSSKAELETKVESLEAELSAAVARNGDLEASKKSVVMAEAGVKVWRTEFYEMVKMKEAAAVAFQAEKAKQEREPDEIRAEKNAAMATTCELIWSGCI